MKIYDFWRDRLQCISKPPGCADVIAQWGVMNLPARAQPPCISVPEVPPSQPACYRPLFRSLPVLSPGHLILAALPRTASSFVMSSLKMLLRPLSWHKASWASGSDHSRACPIMKYLLVFCALWYRLPPWSLRSAIPPSILILNHLQTWVSICLVIPPLYFNFL